MLPVLVIGGTRGTGLLIVRLMHQGGRAVRVLARDPDRARQLFDSAIAVATGGLTEPATLPKGVEGAQHIIFTAGCRSGFPVGERAIRPTEYEGVLNTLAREQHSKLRQVYRPAGAA